MTVPRAAADDRRLAGEEAEGSQGSPQGLVGRDRPLAREELLPLPEDFTGTGQLFMLRVRGDSMIEAGILDGDYVVVRQQPEAERGDIVVAGIPGEEATVKTYTRKGAKVVLVPANARLEPLVFDPAEVTIFGKVVTVLRRL